MNKKLIDVLQRSIHSLESGAVHYNWYNTESCNCGIVAQTALQCGADNLLKKIMNINGSWSTVCRQTGIELNVVYKKLFEIGLTPDDIANLELLDNAEILKELGVGERELYYGSQNNLILYLKAWVRILQREQPEEKVKYVVVQVDRELITDTNKSLINVN